LKIVSDPKRSTSILPKTRISEKYSLAFFQPQLQVDGEDCMLFGFCSLILWSCRGRAYLASLPTLLRRNGFVTVDSYTLVSTGA